MSTESVPESEERTLLSESEQEIQTDEQTASDKDENAVLTEEVSENSASSDADTSVLVDENTQEVSVLSLLTNKIPDEVPSVAMPVQTYIFTQTAKNTLRFSASPLALNFSEFHPFETHKKNFSPTVSKTRIAVSGLEEFETV